MTTTIHLIDLNSLRMEGFLPGFVYGASILWIPAAYGAGSRKILAPKGLSRSSMRS